MIPDEMKLTGQHCQGTGTAHKFNSQHTKFFNCEMVSTFNIKLDSSFDHEYINPSRMDEGKGVWYWLVLIQNDAEQAYGWAYRWRGSLFMNKKDILEIVSRKPLPESFRTGPLTITVFNKWSPKQVEAWAKDQYWFQTFPWTPRRKDGQRTADSNLVWGVIRRQFIRPEGARVLDIGTHYGYHAIRAAAEGSTVIGSEPEEPSRNCAITIDRHIEQQGVEFVEEDPGGYFDVILYLSVHHQIDPRYDLLGLKIQTLSSRCNLLFVELILPSSLPKFGGGKGDLEINTLVGGHILRTYKHRVRGDRRIYLVEGQGVAK